MAEPSPFLLWETSLTLRTGGGHSSNPSLANFPQARQPSAFLEYGGDLMFFRLPTETDSAYVLFSGDNREYLDAGNIPGEQNFLAVGNYLHESPSWWKSGATVSYVYVNQFLDLSEIDSGIGTAQIQGNTINFRPAFGATWSPEWNVLLELPINRQQFSNTTGDFTDYGPVLSLNRVLPHGSLATLSYAWNHRDYDDTPMRTSDGTAIPGSLARLLYNHVNLRWQHHWDAQRRWSTTARLGFTAARDDGSGYYDFNRYRASGVVRYRLGRWSALAEGGGTWTDYRVQTVALDDDALRSIRNLFASLRLEWNVWRELTWNLTFAWDSSVGNVALDSYLVRTLSTGVEWEF